MRELIALFVIFFTLLSLGQVNQNSKFNLENFNSVQEFDSTFQNRINEGELIGVWFTTAVTHLKYRSNPYPIFKDRYSFKKDHSISFVKDKEISSGTWSLSDNNTLTITISSRKIVYQIRAIKDGTLTLYSSNNYITLKKN